MPRLSKIGAAALAAFGWTGLSSVTASYLVVAGGGGGATGVGGSANGGGGGAGGYLSSTTSLNPTLSYTVIVGSGGATNANGSNSQFGTLTASVGGGSGGYNTGNGQTGGSGGGASSFSTSTAGSGTSGQGNAGGTQVTNVGTGGGGGAGAVGGNASGSNGGNGGAGSASSITGTSVTYAGGGGGSTNTGGIAGTGGSGGGGAGGISAAGTAGTANLGGGGGGGAASAAGGQGGSGVVIISYVGAQQFGGGVVTSSGGNTIHTFTTSGTLSPLNSLTASYLIVAGGGGGAATFGGGYGGGGGGGAGGLLSGSGVTIDTNSIYAVTVGASGAGGASAGAVGTNGGNSTFSMVTTTAVGGGGGASYPGATGVGNGGSGGGVGYGGGTIASGGTGISGQGFAGGGKVSAGSGGGGGAGAVGGAGSAGGSGTFPETGGNGGSGLQNPITGSTTGQLSGGIYYVAGGGGGGGYENGGNGLNGGTASAGGGAGGGSAVAGSAGTASTGGGGGGGGGANLGTHYNGGNGGSGVVIISYPGSTQQMAGGTVTVAGGNVIHTFTSSGYLTPIVLVNNSLRFRESASSYLNRTPTTAGNNQKFTMSVWYKPGNIGTSFTNANFISAGGDGSNIIIAGSGAFGSTVDNRFLVRENNATAQFYWPMVFRDPAAWYHIVLAVDTTQTNSNNRAKLYVNGVDQGAFSGTGYSLSATTSFNTVTAHYIGAFNSAYYYTSCYFAEYNWIDGQQLTPNSFGTFNGLGVWQPIRYGGSYGTNGFYLPFNAGTSTFIGSYNGSTAWFNAANNAAFAFGTGSLTIEAWVYPTQNSYGAIFDTRSTGSGGPGVSIYANSGNGIILVNNTTYNPSTYLSLNQWSHIAAVRNGASSWTVYINGNSVLTFTDSSNLTDNACFSGKNYAGNFWFGGFISNLRVVKGTAVYTSNFTPATSPLTNISGTSLLTLQNSTLIDNSTNAFSLTNTGPITTLGAYIFNFLSGTFKDNSPQGNNWTYNNISTAFGSSCDLMNDVPTLTSATTANYAVMNPLANPVGTLSSGNLQINTTTDQKVTTATMALPSTGQYYFEVTATDYVFDGGLSLGLVNSPFLTTFPANGNYIGIGTYSGNYNNGTSSDTTNLSGANVTNDGDIWCIAIDVTNNKFWAGRSRSGTLVWADGVTPAVNGSGASALSLPTGSLYPMIYRGGSYNEIYNFNFGQQPFAHTPPTGFVALNTFNLPTPAIGATASTTANKYFDAVTYAGAGAGTVITTGFYPDFAWMKNRTAAFSNFVQDSVRGGGVYLLTDEPDPDAAVSPSSTFSSTGLTIPFNSSYASNSSYNFVAWAWNANSGSTVSNTAGSITSTVSANTTAGFSIVTYTGTGGTGTTTVGHGCQVGGIATAPSMVIIKRRNASANWATYHTGLTSTSYYLFFDVNTGEANYGSTFISPSSSTLTIAADSSLLNANGGTYVAYCFAQVAGYSAFGSYLGNGSTNGTFVYTGFRPRFIILKHRGAGSDAWILMDTSTQTYNVVGNFLQPSQPDQELNTVICDFLSNGFKLRETYTTINTSSNTYIYMAFAESPFKYANAR